MAIFVLSEQPAHSARSLGRSLCRLWRAKNPSPRLLETCRRGGPRCPRALALWRTTSGPDLSKGHARCGAAPVSWRGSTSRQLPSVDLTKLNTPPMVWSPMALAPGQVPGLGLCKTPLFPHFVESQLQIPYCRIYSTCKDYGPHQPSITPTHNHHRSRGGWGTMQHIIYVSLIQSVYVIHVCVEAPLKTPR